MAIECEACGVLISFKEKKEGDIFYCRKRLLPRRRSSWRKQPISPHEREHLDD